MSLRKTYPKKPEQVYFFGTCLVDMLYPEAGLAGMQLLRREGVNVIYPQNQTCCGQPAWNSGYRDEARRVALTQMACFPQAYPIVVPSGSCAGMMRHHYPALFHGTPQHDAALAFSDRVFELTEFLSRVLKITLSDLGEPVKVALHVSCSARREMGVAGEHQALLEQLKNVELVAQGRSEECCGFGGTFAVKHPEISAAMVEEKATELVATGADSLVSGDCGCLMNITGHLEHRNEKLRGSHIASFLWERTHAADS
ncbi:MAG: (Fe-S)-binding protein [Gammaproteobacteria bacterium]|nr:(Fe-S)-binding protein [Gammaproteobacteria bacterium]HXK57198.1 (Fe-S)-binding protein [Gammaproteobacteria bacterium]